MKYVVGAALTTIVPMASVCLVACASLSGDGSDKQPMAGAHAVESAFQPPMGYYENAVSAIEGQHYALALDYLQAARAQKPDDVRVLTAFGVVYDKLGRFDLSARYYAQAAALEPKSTIVAHDMEYSRILQGMIAAPAVANAAPSGSPTELAVLPTVPALQPTMASLANDKGPAAGLNRSAASDDRRAGTTVPNNTAAGIPVPLPAPKTITLAHDLDYAPPAQGLISAPAPVLAEASRLQDNAGSLALPKMAVTQPVIVGPLISSNPTITPVPKPVTMAHDLDYAGMSHWPISAPAPVLANALRLQEDAGLPALPRVAAAKPVVVGPLISSIPTITPAPKPVTLAHDLDYAGMSHWPISAPAPVLTNAAASEEHAGPPALPRVAAAKPVVVGPLINNIPTITPTPKPVTLAHDVVYARTPRGLISGTQLAKATSFKENAGSTASRKVSAPPSPVVRLAISTTPTAAPAARLVVAARNIGYSRAAQGEIAASTPVLTQAPPSARMVKLAAMPKVSAPPVAVRVSMANAISSRPITALIADRGAQRWNIAQKVNPVSPAKGKAVALIGHPLLLANAAGRGDAGKLVRAYLSGRGWSVAKDIQPIPQVQYQTAIYYPASMIAIAKGLTNTLSLRAKLIASPNQVGLKLVLGRDAASSVYVERMTRTPYRRIASSSLKVRYPE